MTPAECTAVVVTRGDLELDDVLAPLAAFDELIVWNNRLADEDSIVYGRYLAAAQARNMVVYVQDDDTIVDAAAVVDAYEAGKVTCNMPEARRAFYRPTEPTGIALVGWGAVFSKERLGVFLRYFERFPKDELFLRECDRVFTALNPLKLIDVEHLQLAAAFRVERMGREERHFQDLEAIRRRIQSL